MNNEKVFLVVIHAFNEMQVNENLAIAKENGADGVFLINHGVLGCKELLNIFSSVRQKKQYCPGEFWMGLNFLGLSAIEALEFISARENFVDGLWSDNAGLKMNSQLPTDQLIKFDRIRKSSAWKGLFFGSIAFKGQEYYEKHTEATHLVMPYVDVVTTSGPSTGYPPPVVKIKEMKEVLGNKPLAIASGISSENVDLFLPYTKYFLVATSISSGFNNLDSAQVKRLAKIIHNWR